MRRWRGNLYRGRVWWGQDPVYRRTPPPPPALLVLTLGPHWEWWARRRPPERGFCEGREVCPYPRRPCRFYQCRLNLVAEVSARTGTLRPLHPGVPLRELVYTCALDVLRVNGAAPTPIAGALVGVGRETAWRVLRRALMRLRCGLPEGVDIRAALAAAGCDTIPIAERGLRCDGLVSWR